MNRDLLKILDLHRRSRRMAGEAADRLPAVFVEYGYQRTTTERGSAVAAGYGARAGLGRLRWLVRIGRCDRDAVRRTGPPRRLDAGLVMHYFGSKQELFRHVTQANPMPALNGTPDQVTEQILARLAESLANEPAHSLAVLRSMLTHPEAAQAARAGLDHYQTQISRPIPGDDADVRGHW